MFVYGLFVDDLSQWSALSVCAIIDCESII